jgi:hypothetical protein
VRAERDQHSFISAQSYALIEGVFADLSVQPPATDFDLKKTLALIILALVIVSLPILFFLIGVFSVVIILVSLHARSTAQLSELFILSAGWVGTLAILWKLIRWIQK